MSLSESSTESKPGESEIIEEELDLPALTAGSKISPFFVTIVVVLAATAAFGLGRLSKIESSRESITVERWDGGAPEQVLGVSSGASKNADDPLRSTNYEPQTSSKVVASKSGTKYHLPWCPGAQQIKESNKIWFDSPEAAKNAGYSPAANCKGL